MSRTYGLAVPVDDVSPLWSYRGSWAQMSVPSTGHVSMEPTANASITFTGVGIELNGSVGNNWDNFAVVVDGHVHQLAPTNPRPGSKSPLYRNMSLGAGEHRLTLVDRRSSILTAPLQLDGAFIMMGDVDYSTFPSGSGYMEENSSNITYKGSWSNTPDSHAADYINGMTRRTQTMGSTATIQFYGNAITVNGVVGPNYGTYTVSLDNGPAHSFTGHSSVYHANQVMYMANQLDLGDHILVIRKTGNDSKIVSIDSATSRTFVEPNNVSVVPASSRSSLDKGALIGGIVGGVMGLLLLLALALVFFRRRKQQRAVQQQLSAAEDKRNAADDARSEVTLVSAAIAEKKIEETNANAV